jgi:TonB family protein
MAMMKLVALVSFAVCCAMGQGGSGGGRMAPEGVYRVGGGVSAPTLVYKVEPQYSEAARKARYQGTVLLHVEVDPSGKPTNIKVLRSLGLGLDEKAVEAVEQWRFKPGYKDGKPVTMAATIEVNFRLLSPWLILRQDYTTDPDVTKPVLGAHDFPPECKTAAELTLSVQIGSDGKVGGVDVLRSTDPSLNQGAVDAVQHWLFAPARWRGTPEPVGGRIDLVCRPLPH